MIDHSPVRLVFIRICIFLLQHAPWIEASLLLVPPLFIPICSPWLIAVSTALAGLLVLETAFAIFIYRPHKSRLKRLAEHPPPLTRDERRSLFERCIANIPNLERYLGLWFLGANPSEIKRDNVRDFLLWAFFDRDGIQPAPYSDDETICSHEEELDAYIHRSETLLGRTLPPGRGAAIPLRLTLDPIDTCYHSVIWYLIIALLDLTTHAHLRLAGFTHHHPPTTIATTFPPTPFPGARRLTSPSSLPYWHRPHTSPAHRPILFLHGIGIGLWPYTSFLTSLNPSTRDNDNIGILALSLLPISSRLTTPPLSRSAFLSELTSLLATHPEFANGFTLVSHSYGSVLTTHILHSPELSPLVKSLVMIDPVSILLHLPDVAYNFTRRPPRSANEWQLWYFASMDVGVAGVLGRHFFWRENVIWREELTSFSGDGRVDGEGEAGDRVRGDGKRKVAVCLAGKDLIVDTRTVARYLLSEGDFGDVPEEDGFDTGVDWEMSGPEGVEVLWFAGLDHAQVFEGRRSRERVAEVVTRYCEVSGG
ncbi:hypothetical protein QBC34DRAFT_163122 [Podospora aff. communis PSN243]|uniref:AB hydrolase-1 domain-containing protein n=1 Tax=Podospora aff. communis PSN243 TaxID=3040156 RepID=A0AAV9GBS3_9PEZI|nr:hypothetical protein QBC34DRAFT_163122 [Podospora aff. communis PSN243]